MIEPLATIAAIEEFAVNKLILRQGAVFGTGGEDDEDESNEPKEIPPTETGNKREKKESEKDTKSKKHHKTSSTTTASAGRKKDKDDKSPTKEGSESPTVYIRMGSFALPGSMTIFQAVQQLGEWREKCAKAPNQEVVTSYRMWEEPQTIHFSLAPYEPTTTPFLNIHNTRQKGHLVLPLPITGDGLTTTGSVAVNHAATVPLLLSRYGPKGQEKEISPVASSTLRVLRLFHAAHKNWSSLIELVRRRVRVGAFTEGFLSELTAVDPGPFSDDVYVNPKLTNKVLKLLGDPLLLCSGCLSQSWCHSLVLDCPFLFPLTMRRAFFEMACLGPTRALLRLQERLADEGDSSQLRIGRVHKQKVRLSRDNVLEAAKKLVDAYGQTRCFVEIEYYDEVGTGLGPTLEFYTIVSRAMRKREHVLWVTEDVVDAEDIYVRAAGGLFPQPALPSTANVGMFKFIGAIIARALFDRRIMDIPLSVPMLKALRDDPVCLDDLSYIAPEVHKVLINILTRNLGCPVADLGLYFVLPGHPGITLCEKGETILVTDDNIQEYVHLVTTTWLHTSVAMQLCALRDQIHQLVPVETLRMFYPEELNELLCGSQEVPTIEMMEASVLCDHGYSKSSRAIKYLFNITSQFNPSEWSTFVKFVTGASRLPAGGLRSLRPSLTVVRKTQDDGDVDTLPSVMTCANYLKLPDYETQDKMKERLMLAMREGGDAFHLS
jgi:E3 ubiquitin-protein ligase TRIP12